MEIRLVILLAFTSVILIMNAILIWFVYKSFAGFTARVTETIADFERRGAAKSLMWSLRTAADHARTATEATKQRVQRFEPAMGRIQDDYRLRLEKIDTRLQGAANEISASASRMRDFVARPAFSTMTFLARLSRMLENVESGDET